MLHAHDTRIRNRAALLAGLALVSLCLTGLTHAQSRTAPPQLSEQAGAARPDQRPTSPLPAGPAGDVAPSPCAATGRPGECRPAGAEAGPKAGGAGVPAGGPGATAAGAAKPLRATSTLQFGATSFTAEEGGPGVSITVTRAGADDSVVSVDYRVGDNTATQKSDFTYATGTLTFASGETVKTFTVLLTEDSYVDGTETAVITLSNPAGDASLGTPSTAALVIVDDALEETANPNSEVGPFVRQHYHDFLNREPDAEGFAFWTEEIDSCGANQRCVEAKRVNVSAAFYLSVEFQLTGYTVYNTYKAAYGNIASKPVPVTFEELLPDTQQITKGVVVNKEGWRAQLNSNSLTYFDAFAARPRFAAAYPQSMTPEQFVDTLNANAGGVLSPPERDLHVDELKNNTKTRAQVLRAVVEDADLVSAELNRAFVLMQYFGYLRRNPDSAPDADFAGYDFWLQKLVNHGGNHVSAEMVKSFLVSGEYLGRFGPSGRANQSPAVDAGADQTVKLSAPASLSGRVSDDVLPTDRALGVSWSKVSGPGTVVFGAADLATTSATFGEVGTYVLRLTASDTQLADSDDVTITVVTALPAPTITAVVTPAPNAAGWHNSDPTVTFACSDSSSEIETCSAPVTVTTETGGLLVSGTAVSKSGETATASVTVKLDKSPPGVNFTSPADGASLFSTPAALSGAASDALSGVAGVTCNGAAAALNGDVFNCGVPLVPGSNSVVASATDVAGNARSSERALVYTRPPVVTIQSPANLSYLNITPTTVTGTVDDPTATVTINSVPAAVVGGSFSVALPLAEGPNVITASATSSVGATGTASTQVTLDTTPPHVTITSPPDQFVTTDETVSVAGSVNDIVVGTVNAEQAQVTVNGSSAQVSNRTFLATGVPLALGPNVIQAVGRDRVGNAVTTQITVTRQASTLARIRLVSGNNQTAAIGTLLPEPLVVALTNANGDPVPNKPVVFKVTQNDGLVSTDGPGAPTVIATTDAQGRAQAGWKLGMRAGAGGNSVEAYAVDFEGTAIFTAVAAQGAAGKVIIDTGNDQIGAISQPLPKPLIAVVVDGGNNRLANVPVTFTVKEGGGSFGGQPSLTVNTDSDGRAAATLTLGAQEGNANNLVEATFASNTSFPASFSASGRTPGDPFYTTITGVVLDNSNVPIPGVTVRAVLTNLLNSNSNSVQAAAAVETNAQGQFTIPQAPVGFVKLLVDGTTARLPGTYPSLDYDMVTVAGQNNTVGQPIYLLPLKTDNQLCVTATDGGGTLVIPEAPGFSLTFGPGQVTFPGGSKTGCISVTVVHGDKVPMVPGFGQQPRFIVTIQPAGAHFNPPARITLPNVDGLRPREVTEMYSFDHDIGSFVAIGTGVVSDDGQVITSSPGVGVLKAGWHCGGNPNTTGTTATCSECKTCQGTQCVADASQNGKGCGKDLCKACAGGSCAPIKLNTTNTEVAFTFTPPSAAVEKINTALDKLKTLGLIASVNLLEVTGKVSTKECCEATLGKGKEQSGSVSGNFGGFSIKGKVWPPGPIPTFGPRKIDVFGLATLTVKAEFVGGVFVGITGTVSGEVGYKKKDCSKDAADRNGCFFATLKSTLTPSLSAEIGGGGSVTFDCALCKKTTVAVKGSLTAGELSWPIDITNVGFNDASCNSGLSGGTFQANPGQFKISAQFSGSWEPEGSAAKKFDVSFEFLKCEISLSGVDCK